MSPKPEIGAPCRGPDATPFVFDAADRPVAAGPARAGRTVVSGLAVALLLALGLGGLSGGGSIPQPSAHSSVERSAPGTPVRHAFDPGSCEAVSLEGTLRTDAGATALAISFSGRRAETGIEGADALTVVHATCDEDSIAFALEGPNGADGSCLLSLNGPRAAGDCAWPGRGDAAITAIVDRVSELETGSIAPHESPASGD
ncbi:hypothetical protein NK718_18270 [Alsobacter sp. SYSU M60028]|uniref:Serine/threonine protein kinase n=1 Tax=Alsobacter ponti TaxID=2962936 RepID=A0ABT1LIE1_9HYPH|nr:hypothetical protein [Alsobacter ponti]MCP8940475.1 hypothetical protein [Alsobacter ponti]